MVVKIQTKGCMKNLMKIPVQERALLIYDGCGNLIGEIGLQDPGLSDPTLWVWGAAGGLRKAGGTIGAGRYARSGGGINLFKNGTRKFGLDYHRLKYKDKMVCRPHYHLGKTKNQIKNIGPDKGGGDEDIARISN